MSLLFSGFNGFGQWPAEQDMLCVFQTVNVENYFETKDKIENFDWSIEWAYNVFIVGSKIIIKGFSENLQGKSQVLFHPNGGTFTNVSCNDKFLLLYNKKERNVWKYLLDPDVEERWKQLPSFLNSESEHVTSAKDHNTDLNNETVIKIVCGVMINICLTSEGRVFNIPSEISTESIVGKVIDVCCGYEHAVLLTDKGNVYTLGGGSRCQLGQGSIDSSDIPQLVGALAGVEIVKIAAGGWHSCAISSIGDLYTWGWNDRGQLGIRSELEKCSLDNAAETSESAVAQTLEDSCFDDFNKDATHEVANSFLKDDLPIANDVSLGNFEIGKRSQSYVFNDCSNDKQTKRVKSSENNDKDFNSHAIPNLIEIYDSTDGKILELNIVDVSCGSKHTVIKLDDGSIWGTGCNKYGQLGFDVELVENVNHFTMLNVKAKNAALKCGIWATVLLTIV